MKGIGGDVGAGHTLGRYELLVPIARSGMAVVWAARMTGSRGFQKLVAIKSMLPSLTDDDGTFEEMFMAEAQLAAQIRHPNVCEILDLGEQDGVLFIVMERVDGEPLGTIHKVARDSGAGIPIAITTRIGLAVTQGLHAAHELKNQETGESYGLVHRDVSPQNILITHDGVVKIVDFGVAKATSGLAMQKTAVGQMKGKVTYMAPEQARGEPIDRRADVFALGIVLYQLVTNRHPFKGDTPLKTLDKICDAKPVVPPITYTPTCHPALSAAITKALEKDPKKRFDTMADFAHALEGVLSKMVTRGNDLAPFVKQHVGDRNEKRRELIPRRRCARPTSARRRAPAAARTSSRRVGPQARARGAHGGRRRDRRVGAHAGRELDLEPRARSRRRPRRRSRRAGPSTRRASPADTLDEVQSERPNIDFDDTTVDAPNPSSDRSAAAALADSSTVEKSSEPSRPVAAAVAAAAERTPPPKNVASEAPKPKPTSSPPKTRTPSVPAPPASEPRRGRGWIVGALLVLVVALGVVAFTVPGALDRTPWKLAAHPNPVPTASASASATASAATATSAAASAEPSASADASASAAAEAPEAPTASASASASGSAAPRPGAARGYVRPAPAPKGTTSATYENPGF